MSVYLYLKCTRCRRFTSLRALNGGTLGRLVGDEHLDRFIVDHADHEPTLVVESDPDLVDFVDVSDDEEGDRQ